MKALNPKEQIKDLLSRGDIEAAIDLFKEVLPGGSPLINDLILLEGRYHTLQNQYLAAVIAPDAYLLQSNQITAGLLHLLDRWQNDAAELIQLALKSKAKFLDLGNCSLSAIPDEIEQLTELEELNLGSVYWDDTRNQFAGSRNEGAANDLSSERFKGLLKLKKLRKLSVRACNIRTLEGLDQLKQLHTLSVGQNDIKDIAPIAAMTNLKVLSLFGNNIIDIKPLAALKKVEMLSINDNAVVDLSPLSQLHDLEELYASGNRIESIGEISALPKLKTLNLDANLVKYVEPLAYMASLKTINLNSNPIIDCPPEIAFSGDVHLIQT
ncbi:MAG TPA: leucine-rich repeat domain-containing protein, partial [Saprospiraceae bacterium]|nr:leucine-rich repeat domain-containing protein [Saprospiraceae bacterium]